MSRHQKAVAKFNRKERLKKEKKEEARSRPGYEQIQLRIRPALLMMLDEQVRRTQELERQAGVGEARTSRTSVILEAIAHHVGFLPGAPNE
jgi:hypothetical protein